MYSWQMMLLSKNAIAVTVNTTRLENSQTTVLSRARMWEKPPGKVGGIAFPLFLTYQWRREHCICAGLSPPFHFGGEYRSFDHGDIWHSIFCTGRHVHQEISFPAGRIGRG
mmetsp:Transcript_43885/g.114450  ORF Transcript_43885/g.114450 Transcript_43885/m.114450 type:complete len:111 (-) Transcript_43885:914-1246(-)